MSVYPLPQQLLGSLANSHQIGQTEVLCSYKSHKHQQWGRDERSHGHSHQRLPSGTSENLPEPTQKFDLAGKHDLQCLHSYFYTSPKESLESCLPSGMQTRDLLVPESLKYTVTCPGPPDGASPREQQDQAKPQRELPRLATGLRDLQQDEEKQKGKTSTSYCCSTSITLPNTYFQARLRGQAQPCLKSRRLQRCPAPAGSSLHAGLAGAGTASVRPFGCGHAWWLARGDDRTRLPSTLAAVGWVQGSRTRKGFELARSRLRSHRRDLAGGGRDANTSRRERRLFGHRTAALCSLCCRWESAPGNLLAQRGNRDNHGFYLFRGKMCSVHSRPNGPHGAWSMSYFYLLHYLLPMGDDSKYCQSIHSHPPSQSLELLLWPSTPCIKYI